MENSHTILDKDKITLMILKKKNRFIMTMNSNLNQTQQACKEQISQGEHNPLI
tara:strand:- start:492 stop:650 length:159 start_codon:yes stop_codon:yes gene_type:complete